MSDETKPNTQNGEQPPSKPDDTKTGAEPPQNNSSTTGKPEPKGKAEGSGVSQPAPNQDPPKQPSQTAPAPHNKVEQERGKNEDVDKRLERLETEHRELVQRTETLQAAADNGVKDRDYFEYLISRERKAKGNDFNIASAIEKLKASKPELFGITPREPASTTSSAVSNQPGDKATRLKQELDEARKRRDVTEVMRLKTELQLLSK